MVTLIIFLVIPLDTLSEHFLFSTPLIPDSLHDRHLNELVKIEFANLYIACCFEFCTLYIKFEHSVVVRLLNRPMRHVSGRHSTVRYQGNTFTLVSTNLFIFLFCGGAFGYT